MVTITKRDELDCLRDGVRYQKLKRLCDYAGLNGEQFITANHSCGPTSLSPATLDEYLDNLTE